MDAPLWPGAAGALVTIGGITLTVLAACAAATLLEASKSSAVAPVLRRTALAGCDVLAAAGPFLPWSGARPLHREGSGAACRGAAGRHVVKDAFLAAIARAVADARAALVEQALALIGTDERFAAEIAASATARISQERAAQAAA